MSIDYIETITQDDFKEVVLCYDEKTDSNFYLVTWVAEIQDGAEFEDELEFDTLDEALCFFDTIKEPKEYRSVFDQYGFRWEEVK